MCKHVIYIYTCIYTDVSSSSTPDMPMSVFSSVTRVHVCECMTHATYITIIPTCMHTSAVVRMSMCVYVDMECATVLCSTN